MITFMPEGCEASRKFAGRAGGLHGQKKTPAFRAGALGVRWGSRYSRMMPRIFRMWMNSVANEP